MLKIVTVCDNVFNVTLYLKVDFDMRVLIHFQASECSWRDVAQLLRWGRKGRNNPQNLSLPSQRI